MIFELEQNGHYIGFHFDARAKVDLNQKLIDKFLHQYSVYSNHRATLDGLNWNRSIIEDILSVYDSIYSKDIKYISDSDRKWKYGDPLNEIPMLNGKNFQLLIHPIWWTHKEFNRAECYQFFIQRLVKRFTTHFKENDIEYQRKRIL